MEMLDSPLATIFEHFRQLDEPGHMESDPLLLIELSVRKCSLEEIGQIQDSIWRYVY